MISSRRAKALCQPKGKNDVGGGPVSLLHKENCNLGKIISQIAFSPLDPEPHIYIHFNDEDVEVNRIN